MKKILKHVWFCPVLAILFSCASLPQKAAAPEAAPEAAESPEQMKTTHYAAFTGSNSWQVPERPAIPQVPELIMGTGLVEAKDLGLFLLSNNPEAENSFVEDLASIYAEEAAIEGVNHDVAFAQMCLETGFLRFGGLVTPEMNNFCGLGAIGPGQNGLWFPTPREGIRAHIQHLKAYATDAPLKQELVDPRYRYVRLGSSPAIRGLAGTWAADRNYAEKINSIMERLYNQVFGS